MNSGYRATGCVAERWCSRLRGLHPTGVLVRAAFPCAAGARPTGTPAPAGGNPDVRLYIDFDPPNYVHDIEAEQYAMVQAYVCMDRIGDGFTRLAFAMNDPAEDCPGVAVAANWSSLLLPPP